VLARRKTEATPTEATPTPSPKRGRGKVPAKKPTPTPAPTTKTFQQLVNKVKNTNPTIAWDDNKKELNTKFTDDITEDALAIGLKDYQLNALLQLARDKYAIFTNNPKKDKEILTTLAQQRQDIISWFHNQLLPSTKEEEGIMGKEEEGIVDEGEGIIKQ
jgi:hypothetical protein